MKLTFRLETPEDFRWVEYGIPEKLPPESEIFRRAEKGIGVLQ